MSSARGAQQQFSEQSGMADAVLREIRALLQVFAETGETASVDLGGLPISGRDRAELDDVLGRGEVAATIDIAGRSEVWETAYAGIWRVRHFGAAAIAVDLIEVTSCPEILRTARYGGDRPVRTAAAC